MDGLNHLVIKLGSEGIKLRGMHGILEIVVVPQIRRDIIKGFLSVLTLAHWKHKPFLVTCKLIV